MIIVLFENISTDLFFIYIYVTNVLDRPFKTR